MTQPTGSETRFSGDMPAETDVVVVGGGIAGSSAAYHLASAGIRTVLLERGRIGDGATAAAIGVLSPPLRQPFDETVHFRGEPTARRIWDFALRSVAGLGRSWKNVERRRRPDSTFRVGTSWRKRILSTRWRVRSGPWRRRACPYRGSPRTSSRAWRRAGAFSGGTASRVAGASHRDPRPLRWPRAPVTLEPSVLEGVDVGEARRTEGRIVCETSQGEVRAEMVVYATHVDSRRFSSFLGDEIVPMRGQGMISEPGSASVSGSFATHWKLNVWRTDAEGRILLGGWRHDAWDRSYWKTRPELDPHLQENIQAWFESSFPERAPLKVARRWSGIFGWTADYLPLVGPLPGRTGELVISGFSGGGLPFAFESGRVIASIVADGDPVPGSELLNPRRFT